MKVGEKGLFYKTSRRAYFWNYVMAGLVATFLILLVGRFDIGFSLVPRSINEMMDTFIILGILSVISFLVEEPIMEGFIRKYHITTNEIVKIEGLLRKKRLVVPIQNIADVSVKKGILGRIMNFGDVDIRGFKDEFTMKGMANPEEIQRILQAKLTLFRGTGGMSRSRRKENTEDTKEVKIEDSDLTMGEED